MTAEGATTAPRWLVLRTLRIRGRADRAHLDEVLGAIVAEPGLRDLVAEGYVEHKAGLLGGYRLTAAGALEQDRLAAELLTGVQQGAMAALDEDFAPLNRRVKEVVSAWQLRSDGSLNDHSDSAYDRRVGREIVELHTPVSAWFDRAIAPLPWFERYRKRLDRAVAAVRRGDHRWIVAPTTDSYHTVWFELHQDLLLALGRPRVNGED